MGAAQGDVRPSADGRRRTTAVTRHEITQVALELIRTGGLAAVTMRAVAERLSIRAPSLYEHVAGKDELLDLVAREAVSDLSFDASAYGSVRTVDEWADLVVEGSMVVRSFYLRHPGLAGLMQRTLVRGRDRDEGARADLARAQIEALLRLGVPEPAARELFETTSFWSLAAVAAEDAGGPDAPDPDAREARFRRGMTMLTRGVRTELHRATSQ